MTYADSPRKRHCITWLIWLTTAAAFLVWGFFVWFLPFTPGSTLATPAPAAAPAPIDAQALARFLGVVGSPPAAAQDIDSDAGQASRMKLLGVVAAGTNKGAALIAIDQNAAQAFPVGSEVEDGLILRSVNGREAVLSRQEDRSVRFTLRMPALAPPLLEE